MAWEKRLSLQISSSVLSCQSGNALRKALLTAANL